MSSLSAKGPRVLVFVYVRGWPPLPHPPRPQPSSLLLLPRPKRSSRQRHGNPRQSPGLLLLRQLPLRLRSQHRPGQPHPRRRPRRRKTQNSPHRRLPDANSPAGHPTLQARIHQRLRHRRLAPIHSQLRQRQPRLPLPARTQTRKARITPTSLATHHSPLATSPSPTARQTSNPIPATGPIAAHSHAPHQRRIRSAGTGRAEFIPSAPSISGT
jgi:hypothetical protein